MPQETEQLLHGLQAETVQAWGLHRGMEQACICTTKVGHGVPPYAADWRMERVLVCMPPPHVAEHKPNGDHGPMMQLTGGGGAAVGPGVGQTCVLQVWFWIQVAGEGHGKPPLAEPVAIVW